MLYSIALEVNTMKNNINSSVFAINTLTTETVPITQVNLLYFRNANNCFIFSYDFLFLQF